jgi:hypothetical protein
MNQTLRLNPNQVNWIGSRFLDPCGRVFLFEGQYHRAIYKSSAKFVSYLLDSVIDNLVDRGWLVGTTLSDIEVEGYAYVLAHETGSFFAPVDTWNRELIRDAATLYCDINIFLLQHNLGLHDGHVGNFRQSCNGSPVWVDFGSIVPCNSKELKGIVEFISHFVFPLILMAEDPDYTRLMRLILQSGVGFGFREFQLLSKKSLHINAKDRVEILNFLRNILESLKFPEIKTTWSVYTSVDLLKDTEVISSKWSQEGADVSKVLDKRLYHIFSYVRQFDSVKKIVDLGGNSGRNAMLFAPLGYSINIVDLDEESLDKIYSFNKIRQYNINYQLSDVMHPIDKSSGLADCALALALSHHLYITQNFPFSVIASVFASYTNNILVTDFMPNGLGKDRPSPKILPPGYNLESFLQCLSKFFASVEVLDPGISPGGSPRILILCSQKIVYI